MCPKVDALAGALLPNLAELLATWRTDPPTWVPGWGVEGAVWRCRWSAPPGCRRPTLGDPLEVGWSGSSTPL